ncbi:MAG: hypothetical protein IKC35_03390 [Clostridia bacterium]|nr:hypothetical protein [Clostridia bacterium]
MKIIESIDESIDLENRGPSSSRLYNKIAIIVSLIGLIMFVISAIMYQINNVLGLNIFASVIIPDIAMLVTSIYLAVAERLRAKYLGAIVALILAGALLACLIGFVVFELCVYGQLYIAPFNPPPHL